MIGKEEQNKLTENAWAKLYQRLEQDGLLTERTPKKSILKLYRVRWAAAVAILLICSVSAFILMRPSGTSTMLTLHNEKGKPALATTLEAAQQCFLASRHHCITPAILTRRNERYR